MPSTPINGHPSPNVGNAYSAGSPIWSYWALPIARVSGKGQRPAIIDSVGQYVSGYGATRAIRLFVEYSGIKRTTHGFNVGAAGSAQSTGMVGLSSTYDLSNCAGQLGTIGFQDSSGMCYYGRASDGGNTVFDPYGNLGSSSLVGTVGYAEVPSAPGAPTLTDMGGGAMECRWSGAGVDDGGRGVTTWNMRFGEDPSLTSGYTDFRNPSGIVGLQLTPGKTYYFAMAGCNAVSDAANDTGPFSAVRSITLKAGGKRWTGSSWAMSTPKRWNGAAWVDASPKRWNGSAWVNVGA